jgi:hypothetical protein
MENYFTSDKHSEHNTSNILGSEQAGLNLMVLNFIGEKPGSKTGGEPLILTKVSY